MNRLPVPILNQVFSQLHLVDKIECMLVCHDWELIIKEYTLYETIKLSKWENLQQLLKIVQQNPSSGRQVKRLILGIMSSYKQKVDPYLLMKHFPNVRLFELPAYVDQQTTNQQMLLQRRMNIEHILDNGCRFAYRVISENLCPRLKSLFVISGRYPLESTRTLIDALVNVPTLSHLSMSGFKMSFEDLERLHLNLPFISSFNLRLSDFQGDAHLSSMLDIEPATSISKIDFFHISFPITALSSLIRYINKKYTKLIEFGIDCQIPFGGSQEVLERISKEELASLFQGLGPQLKTLSLNFWDFKLNYFNMFKNASFDIQSLSVGTWYQLETMPSLVLSGKFRHLRTLKLRFSNLGTFEWLTELESLKNLELEHSAWSNDTVKRPFQLSSVLEMCGHTLESLSIRFKMINVDMSDMRPYPGIKSLCLRRTRLPKNFDSFVSASFPTLGTLVFEMCKLRHSSFILPHHHLLSVEIMDEDNFNMLLLETAENSRRWYATKGIDLDFKTNDRVSAVGKNDGIICPSNYSRPYDAWNGTPDLVFSCMSVRSLMLTCLN